MSLENTPDSMDMEISAHSTPDAENLPDASASAAAVAAANGNNGNGNGNGHVCTDPDEHGPQGNGNGYGHNKGGIAPQNLSPYGTDDYGGKVDRKDIASEIHVEYGWIYEGNDSSKHTDNEYNPPIESTPSTGLTPLSEFGVPISVWLTKGEDKDYNDGYVILTI